MNSEAFAKILQSYESFHNLRTNQYAYTVLRFDGVSFSSFTKNYQKPFDYNIHEAMTVAAEAVLKKFGGIIAYTQSDEISLLLGRDNSIYGGVVEKLASIGASQVTAEFNNYLNERAIFDGRVVSLPSLDTVVDYFRWRRSDAERNFWQSAVFYNMQLQGYTPRQAHRQMNNWSKFEQQKWLAEQSIDADKLPVWAKGGSLLCFDAVQGENDSIRREIRHMDYVPNGGGLEVYINTFVSIYETICDAKSKGMKFTELEKAVKHE